MDGAKAPFSAKRSIVNHIPYPISVTTVFSLINVGICRGSAVVTFAFEDERSLDGLAIGRKERSCPNKYNCMEIRLKDLLVVAVEPQLHLFVSTLSSNKPLTSLAA